MMSIDSTHGIVGSSAGTPLAQARGSEIDRRRVETDRRRTEDRSDLKADAAAGMAESDGQEKSVGEREGDGRQPWEAARHSKKLPDAAQSIADSHGRDAKEDSGNTIDLCG